MANDIQEILDIVADMYADMAKGLDESMKGWEYETSTATKEEDEAFVRLMINQNPPQWWTHPDGSIEFNSPWIMCLKYGLVEDPKGAWRGVKAALERLGPLPMPVPVMQPVAIGVM